jgi:long-subunit acyl-CoA synthetase (AMP-forming)
MKIVQSETPVPAIQLEPKDLLSLVYTSGTTGKHNFLLYDIFAEK